MNGYTRYAATAVWVGNADKSLVRDGSSANFASADTTIRLFKNWMGRYHEDLKAAGIFSSPAGFDDLRPTNVVFKPFQTATTERGAAGGCSQYLPGWQRTDVDYKGGDCQGKGCVALPAFRADLAVALAKARGIPACTAGGVLAAATTPSVTATATGSATAIPSVSASPTASTPTPTSGTTPGASPSPMPTATATAAATSAATPMTTETPTAAGG